MKTALETIVLILLLLLMAAAALFGMLMNVLFLWLLISACYILVTRIISIARKKAYFGIWKPSEYPPARGYLPQAILRNGMWITVALAVFVSLVPIQFSPSDWQSVLWQLGGAAAILCVLEWIPSRRRALPTNVFYALVFVFVALQLAKIYWPYSQQDGLVIGAPFQGEWYTSQGGNSCLINHHYYAGSQRHALDLILPEDGPLPLRGGTELQKYGTFGQPLFSPIDGVVVDVRTDCEDQPIGSMDPANAAGNYVTIKTDSGVFILLAHLQEGSVLVEKDDRVSVGQELAKCGNSGNSSQPHLHIQAMTEPQLFSTSSRPIPLRFKLPGRDASRMYKRNDVIKGIVLPHGAR